MSFGKTIQGLRQQSGLSQIQLAQRAGVPVRSVENWEQGHRLPRPQALLPLAEALGVAVESLIRAMPGNIGQPPRGKGKAPSKKRGGRHERGAKAR